MNRWRTQLGPMAGAVLLLAACAAPQPPRGLAYIFDGVAPEARPAAPVGEETVARVPDLYLAARAAPPGIRHKPYAERACLSCHESQFSQKLRSEIPALCQSCHPAIAEPKPYPHTPVAQGQCLVCHHPHESLEPALLIGAGWSLCGGCHEERLVAATPTHSRAAGSTCQSCHDPHGGRDPHMLKTPPAARLALSAVRGSP